jgi:hypothetical protein
MLAHFLLHPLPLKLLQNTPSLYTNRLYSLVESKSGPTLRSSEKYSARAIDTRPVCMQDFRFEIVAGFGAEAKAR